jgi:hypothetical protein
MENVLRNGEMGLMQKLEFSWFLLCDNVLKIGYLLLVLCGDIFSEMYLILNVDEWS